LHRPRPGLLSPPTRPSPPSSPPLPYTTLFRSPRLFGRNPDLCCHLRKVEPLSRALEGYMAWFSGIRRDETASRRDRRVVEWDRRDRKSTRLNSSHVKISYAVFCLKKKNRYGSH